MANSVVGICGLRAVPVIGDVEVGSAVPLLWVSPAGERSLILVLFASLIERLGAAPADGDPMSLPNGVVFVGAVATTCSISSGTLAGVTPSTIVKAGSSSTVVGLLFALWGSVMEFSDGGDMFDALSMSFCTSISHALSFFSVLASIALGSTHSVTWLSIDRLLPISHSLHHAA